MVRKCGQILASPTEGRPLDHKEVQTMPTIKASYEAVFIFSLSQGEENVTALKEKFSKVITKYAELGEIDEWGKRKLAYLINDEAEGYYVLYTLSFRILTISVMVFPSE